MESTLVPIGVVSAELGLSATYIRQLTDEGVLEAIRTQGGHRRYDLGRVKAAWALHAAHKAGLAQGLMDVITRTKPTVSGVFVRAGLEEDRVWPEYKAALAFVPGSSAQNMSGYVFLEMLNNAIDHSGGTSVSVRVWSDPSYGLIEIADDGVGAFARLQEGLGLDSHLDALAELSKGKRTTAPNAHTGQGIFFTSKLVDVFTISANGLDLIIDNVRADVAVGVSTVNEGTRVRLLIDRATTKDVEAAFKEYTHEDFGFTRSRPTVKLFELGLEFVSRSEARRLLIGMEKFTEVLVDFAGVRAVGQGFVDELVRVWPRLNPDTQITCINMNDAVEFMVKRGLPRQGESSG